MLERIKQIPARLLEFWKKYTKKQRAIFECCGYYYLDAYHYDNDFKQDRIY